MILFGTTIFVDGIKMSLDWFMVGPKFYDQCFFKGTTEVTQTHRPYNDEGRDRMMQLQAREH